MAFSTLIAGQLRGWRATEAAWLAFSISAIVALSLHWNDSALGTTAAVTGMMYTVLAGKGKLSCFLFGMVNTPLYAYMAFNAGYYGDFAMNIYYFAMMFPGFVAWMHNQSGDSGTGIVRTRLTTYGRIRLAVACLAAIPVLWTVLHLLEGSRPLCDSVTNVLSVAAMFLTVRRAIEEWALWIIVDIVEVFMWWRAWCTGEGSISVLLMWMLFLANGIYLLSLWMRVEARRNASTSMKPRQCGML